MKKHKYTPAVKRKYLILISGLMWLSIGIMLNTIAIDWLSHYHFKNTFIYLTGGIIISLIIHHFGFLKIVDKNLGRIKTLNPETCVFAFLSWKSYLLVLIMISMGIMLRHSQIPRNILSVIYIGLGLALILSSIRYLRVFIRTVIRGW
ncbi:MAG TPA: hypothetical protein DEQ09_07265 [Bacteroidales bacterium]|nr:hypothetical protein [Bacteroidales bacterium]